jgi:autotransporter-associated beta strand protein
VKGGTGSWELSATNSYTGSTTVNAGTLTFSAQANLSSSLTVNTGGTLRLAATDAFGSSAAVTLNGGTLQFSGGAFSQNFSGTPLSLTASSTIDFGSGLGASTLSFGSSSAQTWTGTLSIANYSAGSDVLRFGTDANALSPSQLAAINFSGFAAGAQIDSNGYVTPVPEPSTYALIFGSFAFGLSAYRLRKKNGRSEC